MRPRIRPLAVAALAGAAVVLAGSAVLRAEPPGWRNVAWPFPRDAWPPGLAFTCAAASCGAGMEVYLRPKRGFCANCDTGVTGDAEVDGVADLDMISADFTPLAPGGLLSLGQFAGRVRAYAVPTARGTLHALGLAMTRHRQCDLVVAVAVGAADPQARSSVAALLTSPLVVAWLDRQLDGR